MTGPEPRGSPEEAGEEGGPRARRMGGRVRRAAAEAGVPGRDLALLAAAHRAAMRFREGDEAAGLPSEHHPAYLHPGRTVLVLLEDLEERDARVLAVGAMADGREPELRVRPAVAARVLGAEEEAYEWWASLPLPDWGRPARPAEALPDEALLERLVTAPEPVRRIALADALDHLRHAHLWEDPAERSRAAELAMNVFGPLAPRVHPILERRLEWWIRRVGRRLAGPGA